MNLAFHLLLTRNPLRPIEKNPRNKSYGTLAAAHSASCLRHPGGLAQVFAGQGAVCYCSATDLYICIVRSLRDSGRHAAQNEKGSSAVNQGVKAAAPPSRGVGSSRGLSASNETSTERRGFTRRWSRDLRTQQWSQFPTAHARGLVIVHSQAGSTFDAAPAAWRHLQNTDVGKFRDFALLTFK